jgi:hypothetical protein
VPSAGYQTVVISVRLGSPATPRCAGVAPESSTNVSLTTPTARGETAVAAGALDAEGEGAEEEALDDDATLDEEWGGERELQAQASNADAAPSPETANVRPLVRPDARSPSTDAREPPGRPT